MNKRQIVTNALIIVAGVGVVTATTAFAETNMSQHKQEMKRQITAQQKAEIDTEAKKVAAQILGININDQRLQTESFMQIAKEQGVSDQELLRRGITAVSDEMKAHGASDEQVQSRVQKLDQLQLLFNKPVNSSIDSVVNQIGQK